MFCSKRHLLKEYRTKIGIEIDWFILFKSYAHNSYYSHIFNIDVVNIDLISSIFSFCIIISKLDFKLNVIPRCSFHINFSTVARKFKIKIFGIKIDELVISKFLELYWLDGENSFMSVGWLHHFEVVRNVRWKFSAFCVVSMTEFTPTVTKN